MGQNVSFWFSNVMATLRLYVGFSFEVRELFWRVRYKKEQEIKGMLFSCNYSCEIFCGVIAMSA